MKKLIFAVLLSTIPSSVFADDLSEGINNINTTTQMCVVNIELSTYGKSDASITCDGHELLRQQIPGGLQKGRVSQSLMVSQVMQKGLRLRNCETTLNSYVCYLSRN